MSEETREPEGAAPEGVTEDQLDSVATEEAEQAAAEEEPRDPRQRAMKSIRAKVREQEGLEDEPEPEPDVVEEAPPVQDKPTTRKLKVDGKEIEVSEDDLISAAQKQYAGENRLREAAANRTQAPTPPAGAQPETPAPEPSAQPGTDDLQAWARAIAEGDEDQIVDALSKFREAFQVQPAKSDTDVAAMVQNALGWSRVQDEHTTSEAAVAKDFPEIKDDPFLYGVASQKATIEVGKDLLKLGYTEDQLAAADPRDWWIRHSEARMSHPTVRDRVRTYEEIYRLAASDVREKYVKPADPSTQSRPTTDLAARRDKKAGGAIHQVRPVTGAATAQPPKETSPRAAAKQLMAMRGQR